MDQFIDVLQKTNSAIKYLDPWYTNVKRWQSLYEMAHYPKVAGKREVQYSDPTFTNTVDLAVGIMLANSLRWHSYGFTPSYSEQLDTSMIEKLMEGILTSADEREERFLRYELFQSFTRDGGGIIYSVFDPEIAANSLEMYDKITPKGVVKKYRFTAVPMEFKVIDPLKFFALPGGPKRWLLMGRRETMAILDVEKLYDIRIDKYSHLSEAERQVTLGEFMDVWDWVSVDTPVMTSEGVQAFNSVLGKPEMYSEMAVRNTIIFDGMPIRGPRIMHGYTDLPYSIQFFKPTGNDPSKWQSIISPMEDTVNLLERSFNRRAYQIDVYTGLPLVTKVQPGRKINIDPGLYNHVSISPDESIEFPSWPGNPPDLQMHIDFLRSRIQQSGFSDVMFGQGSGEAAGYAMAQLGDQNRIRLEQPIKHIELLFSTWAKKTLKLLQYFAKDVDICVYGHQRGTDYVDYVDASLFEGYQIRAEIRPVFPNEEQRRVAMATQVKGILSNYTIMERYLGEEQPSDEEERMLIEKVTNHPASIQYAVMKQLKKRADMGDEVAAMTLQQMQNGGISNKPGRNPSPRNPEQLTGLQSPTGQPIPQAIGNEPAGQSASDIQENMSNARPGMDGGM